MAFRTQALRVLLLAAGLLSAVVIAAPAGEAQIVLQLGEDGRPQRFEASPQRKLHGRFLHITGMPTTPFLIWQRCTAQGSAIANLQT